MAQIDAFFRMMQDVGASDLHLSAGNPPIIRLHGDLQRIKYPTLEHEALKRLLYEITPELKIKNFEETGDVDFAYSVPGLARYRVNFYNQRRGVSAAFRTIPEDILSLDDLGMPDILKNLARKPKGLVVVTGATGSGKSTTLAAIIDFINENNKSHIISIEDPVEFVHKSKSCLINQREVGNDTKSFNSALRGALREDPDVILVGEMRDLETISLALEAAETGHLVFATLHTMSAAKTIDRIIEIFPAERQAQIRTSLSDSIQGVVAQQLLKRSDKPGRVAALEILVATPAVRNLIREGKTFQLQSVIETGKKYGMISMEDSLLEFVKDKKVSPLNAYLRAPNKAKLRDFVTSEEIGTIEEF